ncbi:MAG: hypothetical protein ABR929_07380, partial [Roseiarcus sp.]
GGAQGSRRGVWLSPLFRELNLVAAHAVVDDCERIVERGDAFAGDLLEKELAPPSAVAPRNWRMRQCVTAESATA